jgi:hypothetical protein
VKSRTATADRAENVHAQAEAWLKRAEKGRNRILLFADLLSSGLARRASLYGAPDWGKTPSALVAAMGLFF